MSIEKEAGEQPKPEKREGGVRVCYGAFISHWNIIRDRLSHRIRAPVAAPLPASPTAPLTTALLLAGVGLGVLNDEAGGPGMRPRTRRQRRPVPY